MFSGLLEPLRRNIGLRLSLWYALIFTASSVALLALAYYLLAAALGAKDREVLEGRLKDAAGCIQAGGVSALRTGSAASPSRSQNTMFVRLVNTAANTTASSAPRGLAGLQGRPGLGRSAPDSLHPHPQERRARLHAGQRPTS